MTLDPCASHETDVRDSKQSRFPHTKDAVMVNAEGKHVSILSLKEAFGVKHVRCQKLRRHRGAHPAISPGQQ